MEKIRRTGSSLGIYDDINHHCGLRICARSNGLAGICAFTQESVSNPS